MLELARESDFEAIRRLSVQIHDLHAAWRPDIYFHSDEPYARDAFLEDVKNRMVYTAKLGDTIVGYVVLSVSEKSGPGVVSKKVMRLDSICVDEDFRGHGIGAEHDIFARKAAFFGHEQFAFAGAIHPAALFLENFQDMGIGQGLDGEIFLKAGRPGKGGIQRPGLAADARFIIEMEGRGKTAGRRFKNVVRQRKIRHMTHPLLDMISVFRRIQSCPII